MKKTILMIMLALLGMSQLGAQEYEYVPFVREGVKWVYHYHNDNENLGYDDGFIPAGDHYFTFEMKGDTLIDGKWYKPVHLYGGNAINELNDTVPVYLREENKVVYGIIPDDRRYWECPIGIGTRVCAMNLSSDVKTGVEFVLYDFSDPAGFYDNLEISFMPYTKYYYNHSETVKIGNCLRKRLVVNSANGVVYYIIEGIGYAGFRAGMPLNYLYDIQPGIMTTQVTYILSHVIEDGEIIFRRYEQPQTVINEVVAELPQRQLDENYYNLMGQPVGKEVPTVPGIYIHQGKKILVR